MSEGAGRSRTPTLGTVAQAAGVSVQTVSNVLNAPHKVGAHTLARVEAEIASQGYRPNRHARSLRTRRSFLLGYCWAHPTGTANALLERFIHAVTQSAERREHHVLLFTEAADLHHPMSVYRSLVAQHAVDGFVISDTTVGDERQEWLSRHDVPFAAFGRRWAAPEIGSWVDVDGAAGIAAAVDHVVELGHRRLAYLGWPDGSGVGDDRASGYVDAARAHGLAADLMTHTDGGLDEGRRAASELLDLADPPTAFVCVSDDLALGCDQAVRERGLLAGRDVAITGFDDSTAVGLPGVAITSVRQPVDDAGEHVVRLLLERLANRLAEPEQILLTPTLVVRTSTDHPDRHSGH
jgi:DNA-binding LacI/PurR family transcriptional regulator